MSDLVGCSIQEVVAYPSGIVYQADSPPFPANASFPNPTGLTGPAKSGFIVDTHSISKLPVVFVKPYTQDSFTAYQTFQWSCKCGQHSEFEPFDGMRRIPIVRKVTQNSDGSWQYEITEDNASVNNGTSTVKGSATINPIQ
jgi:hypothetical protein